MSEIDDKLEEIRERRLSVNSATVDAYVYDSDVAWLSNYVDMLKADLWRCRNNKPDLTSWPVLLSSYSDRVGRE